MMRVSLGHSIVIENVSGANGSIGVGRAARATPDGHTIDLGQLNSHDWRDQSLGVAPTPQFIFFL